MTKPAAVPESQFFTRGTLASRPQWIPVLAFVVLCMSVAALIASVYHVTSSAPPVAEVENRADGTNATFALDYTTRDYALWAEMRMSSDEASYAVDHYAQDLATQVVATDSTGAPVVFVWDDRLKLYEIEDGGDVIVGFPVGTTFGLPATVTLPDIGFTGIGIGPVRASSDVIDVTSLVWLLPALAAGVTVFATVRPRRSFGQLGAESAELARRASERADRAAAGRDAEIDSHNASVARYRREIDAYIRGGGDPDAPGAPQPPARLSDGSGGWGFILIGLIAFAGPLLALLGGILAAFQGGVQQIVVDSPLSPLMPLMGDTAWRVFVMTTTLGILLGIGPLVLAMFASGFRVRILRIGLTILAVLLVVVAAGLATVALNFPIERMTL